MQQQQTSISLLASLFVCFFISSYYSSSLVSSAGSPRLFLVNLRNGTAEYKGKMKENKPEQYISRCTTVSHFLLIRDDRLFSSSSKATVSLPESLKQELTSLGATLTDRGRLNLSIPMQVNELFKNNDPLIYFNVLNERFLMHRIDVSPHFPVETGSATDAEASLPEIVLTAEERKRFARLKDAARRTKSIQEETAAGTIETTYTDPIVGTFPFPAYLIKTQRLITSTDITAESVIQRIKLNKFAFDKFKKLHSLTDAHMLTLIQQFSNFLDGRGLYVYTPSARITLDQDEIEELKVFSRQLSADLTALELSVQISAEK